MGGSQATTVQPHGGGGDRPSRQLPRCSPPTLLPPHGSSRVAAAQKPSPELRSSGISAAPPTEANTRPLWDEKRQVFQNAGPAGATADTPPAASKPHMDNCGDNG